jgi:hypothetical protein
MDIKHSTILSLYREYYAVDVKVDGTLHLHSRILNIFQRVFRYFFGAYDNTIWTEKKSTRISQLYPEAWKKIEKQIINSSVFQKVFKIPKTIDATLTYLEGGEFYNEHDETKIVDTLHWILDNYEFSEDDTKKLMKDFILNLINKSRILAMKYERTYLSWIETLNKEQLKTYIQLLPKKKNDAPLLYHLRQEFSAAALTGKTDSKRIGKRIRIAFSTFTAEHAKAVYTCDEFWNLLEKYPAESAESLKPEALAIIAKKKSKHKYFLKKMIPRLPEDDLLYEKLLALAPYTTHDIELVLTAKAGRLGSELKKEIVKNMNTGLHNPVHDIQLDNNSLENVKSRNSRSFSFQLRNQRNSACEIIPNKPSVPRRPSWTDDQCIDFLKVKKYTSTNDEIGEEVVFHWLLEHEDLYNDDESMRCAFDAFIKYSFSKTMYAENITELLLQLNKSQLSFFVVLLGDQMIDRLWDLEAKFTVSQTNVEKKVERLKTIVDTLSEEQFQASLDIVKFYEILRLYPEELGPLFTTEQWKLFASHTSRDDEILTAITAMVSKSELETDQDLPHKLEAICDLLKLRNENIEMRVLRDNLRFQVRAKLRYCPKKIQKKLLANL